MSLAATVSLGRAFINEFVEPANQRPPPPLAAAFNHPDWLYELKWDGFRALAYVEKGACRLVSRKGNPFKSWPDMCATVVRLHVESAILVLISP